MNREKILIGIIIILLSIITFTQINHFIICNSSNSVHPQCSIMDKKEPVSSKLCTGKNLAYPQCQSEIIRQKFLYGQVLK